MTETRHAIRVLAVIPVYNHAATLRQVVEQTLAVHPDVLVVDDGSTDNPEQTIADLNVPFICHETNQGKGAALLSAARYAAENNMTHILSLDADGQHDPADIAKFLPIMQSDPFALVIGARDFSVDNVPGSSKFGRSFSNFWLRVQTGKKIADAQSGFRAYPVALLQTLNLRERRYAFEIEILAKAAWAGFSLREVPISVYYPPREERISHFQAFRDNLRISLLNTRLTMRSFLPVPHRQYNRDGLDKISPIHPLRSLRILLAKDATPWELALSCALGVFLGTLPLLFVHSIAIIFVAGFMGLNRIAGLAASQLCIPPFVPALCLLTGYYLRHGRMLTEYSLRTLGYEGLQRVWEWVLGSLLVAPVLSLLVGGLVYVLALGIKASLKAGAEKQGSGVKPDEN